VDRLPELARELVRAQIAVICAGGPPSALTAKATTTTIPIVFTSGIKLGLVESYNRPGANVAGVALLVDVLGAKRLGLLREIVPATTLIAILLNPSWPTFETQLNDVEEAARAVGQQIHILRANTEREIDAAFDTAKKVRASAMMVGPSTFFTLRRDQIVGLAARDALPTIYGQREFVTAGGRPPALLSLVFCRYRATNPRPGRPNPQPGRAKSGWRHNERECDALAHSACELVHTAGMAH
jgi:putative ABC transport system substrate-binding protein